MRSETLLTARELAAHCRVTPATIHRWHRQGVIPGLRAGRHPVLFELHAVMALLRSQPDTKEDESAIDATK